MIITPCDQAWTHEPVLRPRSTDLPQGKRHMMLEVVTNTGVLPSSWPGEQVSSPAHSFHMVSCVLRGVDGGADE
ncbi:hypothetical protein EYF80_009788 [Liparis tanakae]|uniref:Uncharacterized protein n=1 Tax=Liparis tanakae TaxID=230148 RepID=A0A4Z2IQ57_9TELE|nr:hypothetical protein EYF80_009788 [Liparis tanakae]